MARRNGRKKTRSRRKKQGISLINMAETIMLANVATQTLFKTNAYTFIVGDELDMSASGMQSISLRELFKQNQASRTTRVMGGGTRTVNTTSFDVVKNNLAENWISGVAGMILVPLGFKFGRKIAAPAIRKSNKLLQDVGIASTVRV